MDIYMVLFFLFCATSTGAVFGRGKGGNLIDLPRPLEQVLFCLVFGPVMQAFGVPLLWCQVIAFSLAVAVLCTGHGLYFLSLAVKATTPERLDFILRPFFGIDPRTSKTLEHLRGKKPAELTEQETALIAQTMSDYGMKKLFWRCLAGMAMTGGLVSLAPGVTVMLHGHIAAGLLLALSGTVKAVAYYVSHQSGHDTEGGEWGHGGGQWFLAVLIMFAFSGVWL